MAGFREWWASRPRVRVTGVTTPFVGMTWELKPSDRQILEQLVTFLDDRSVLVVLLGYEHRDRVLKSVRTMRSRIERDREQLPAGTAAHVILGDLLEACRKYLRLTEGIVSKGQYERLSLTEQEALTQLRRVFMDQLSKLKGIINVRLIDDVVAKVTIGYIIPVFEYEMQLALLAPGGWSPVPAFVPDENGMPRELPTVLGHVRADENLVSDGKIIIRWLATPAEWSFSFKQPDNYHELLFEACFDRSGGAEDPSQVSEAIPDEMDLASGDLLIFQQILHIAT
jgi:hypothetical protein